MKKLQVILFVLLAIVTNGQDVKLNKYTFGQIEARHIGPAVMSGRIAAIDAVQSDPRILYVGTAGGGVWKTENAGTTFEPIFDKYNQCIGAVTIDQKHPDTIWVGTGEVWTRNSVSVGDGIYKSTDGGEKWKRMGLKDTERIGKIIIHPEDPNIIYVAALGPLWGPGEARGVYKSMDGGKKWEKILYVDENTGCADLAIDPSEPDILYAAMWDFRRKPHFFRSGGPGSGLYITRDGGVNWNKQEEGMPDGVIGRIALAVSPANPDRVWAAVEAEQTVMLRSDDKGKSWENISKHPAVGERPFYFAYLVPDPVDTARVYKPGFTLWVSTDGGKYFLPPFVGGGNVHSDLHAMWISEKDPNYMYLGTDGGMYVSRDRGNTWGFMRNLPVSTFYHVAVDDQKPYNVYGGLQDNGSWMAPSKSPGGINNGDWRNVGTGDGFNCFVDPADNNILYWQWQGGNYRKRFMNTGEVKDIKPYSDESMDELRFNWDAPIVIGKNSGALYVGAQYVFRSTDFGDSYDRISPDLTTNDPEKLKQEETGGLTIDNSTAENHCTIYTIAESPLNNNIIWVGTDDGNLQLTTDGGKNWKKLNNNIQGLPADTWCSYVWPSRFDENTIYVTFDGHKSGDMKPYVYRSDDLGETWTSLVDKNLKMYCHVIIEDTRNPDLLFLGTEFGLFLSIDQGKNWTAFTGNLPPVSIRDMVIQERTNDLVLATHGRGIVILDDITPIRQLNEELIQEDVVFLDSRPYEIHYLAYEMGFLGDDEFVGYNTNRAVIITYYLKKRHVFGDMRIEIWNEDGELVKTLPGGKRKGINRVSWNMQRKAPKVPSSVQIIGAGFNGPAYPPGIYTVKMFKGDEAYEGKLDIIYDPDSPHSIADRDLRYESVMRAYNMLEDLAYLDAQIIEMRDKSKELAKEEGISKKLKKELDVFSTEIGDYRKELLATKRGRITGERRLRERISNMYSSIMSYAGKPAQSQLDRLGFLEGEVAEVTEKVENYKSSSLAKINKGLKKAGKEEITVISREAFMAEE